MNREISTTKKEKNGVSLRWLIFCEWVNNHFQLRYDPIIKLFEQKNKINTVDDFEKECFNKLDLYNPNGYLYNEMTLVIELYKTFNFYKK